MKRPHCSTSAKAERRKKPRVSLVLASDVPPECSLIPLIPSPESSTLRTKHNDFREVDNMLRSNRRRIIIEAPTGSGKSRKCPNVIINYMEDMRYSKPLLVLSSATIDVVGMQETCEHSSRYKLGGGRHSRWLPECKCVYASIGLATRWYANNGTQCFDEWGGVFSTSFKKPAVTWSTVSCGKQPFSIPRPVRMKAFYY